MLDPANVPPVAPDELLARFVVSSRHLRADRTVKQDAFIPHPHTELSLTRHRDATEEDLWCEGQRVVEARGSTLFGRADVLVAAFVGQELAVEARPIRENPNHADAINWPAEKSTQKMKAVEIAKLSKYLPMPD